MKELTFEQAIMKVKKDIVHIYLGIEIFYIEDATTTSTTPKTTSSSPQNNMSNK